MEIPDRIDRLNVKRGIDWTPAEVRMVKEWLCERQQIQTVWYHAARYLGKGATQQDIEDAISDIYAVFDQACTAYKPGGPGFVSFLLNVCFKNNCLREGNRFRKRMMRETSLEYDLDDQILTLQLKDTTADGDPSRLAENRAFSRELTEFLNTKRLSENQKTVFVLRYLEGMSYEDIVEVTGSPMGSVKGWLNRATATARRYLEERGWSECHGQK